MHLKAVMLGSSALALLVAAAVPVAAQTAAPSPPAPVATEVAAADDADTIIVTGLRRSLQSAQGLKRNSDQIVDAVVAEDIGKLPDINVSESLARIVGVQVDRANGEASDISIRGLRDFATTYNGREIFTAEVRRVATQDFPAGGVAALEVFKSTTAEQVEGGIAGLVNVRSRRPFDFKGLEVAGAINGTYADQADSYDWNGNILLSNRWETGAGEFGALINVSYTQLHYLDSARFDSGDIGTAQPDQSTAGAFRYPRSVGIFYGEGNRWRPSANAALQWRPTPELEFYFDALYQGFRRERSDRIFDISLRGDGTRFTDVVLVPGTDKAQSLTATTVDRIFRFQGATNDKTDTYQFGFGGAYTGDRFKASFDLARTTSRFDLSVYSLDSFSVGAPVVNVNFDVPQKNGGVEFSLPGFDTNLASNYTFGGLFDRAYYAKGDDIQGRIDFEYETKLDVLPKIAFGARYTNRHGSNANGERFNGGSGPITAVPYELALTPSGFRGDVQPTRTWITPTYESIRGNIEALRTFVGAPTDAPIPREIFKATEHTFAGYGQLSYAFDIGDIGVDGLAGARVVQTDTRFGDNVAVSYIDYLPNFSGRIRFTDTLQLRGAYTQTRTRPGFDQTGPTFIDPPNPSQPFRNGRGGNPGLKPVSSDNYDVSLEYYFSATGLAAVSLFRRDIDGFISTLQTTVQDPTLGELRLERPENGGIGRLDGVEAQFSTFFDFEFLPQWARGFGVQANYTYIDGKQQLPARFGGDPNASFGIPNVSKHTYNLVALYEANKVSARLAYNVRSKFVNTFDNAQGGVLAGEFTDKVARLDFSASYTPIENVTIAADVSNILGTPFRNYRTYTNDGDSFPRDVRYEERIFSVGLRLRL